MNQHEITYICEPTRTGAAFRPGNVPEQPGGVLAIDPGLYLGWAYKAGDYIAAGFEDMSRQTELYGSTAAFIRLLVQHLAPYEARLERYFIGGGAHESRSIEQRGAIKAALEQAEVSWKEIHPSTVRKCLGIGGRPSDPQIREAVSSYFGTPQAYHPDPNSKRTKLLRPDTFDALALLMAEADR
ncbi:MAG: hypothetical protein J5706_04535 [Elusimicrobiales bacterium]|nr:hypothetical protein [Elusimicrobiales bacterium]